MVEDGTAGIHGPIEDVSVWDITVLNRGSTPAVAQGLDGALVSNVGFRNIWFRDLGREAKTLAEMSVTQTAHSSNIVVKG